MGSGTDPTEGSALGMAVLRRLAGCAALTMATTHHGRLKSLKYSEGAEGGAAGDGGGEGGGGEGGGDGRVSVFENACVEFDVESMAPTYRMLWGVPGRSNALAIAERLGMPADVVADARTLLDDGSDGVGVDEVIAAARRPWP